MTARETTKAAHAGAGRRALFALGIALVATVVRADSWKQVFTSRGVRFLVDGDPYYHVRRARMILEAGSVVWRDSFLNYPRGADIVWPPLFDLLLAGTAAVAGLGHPSPATLSLVAAWLPFVLGLAGIGIGAAFAAEVFGPAAGIATALLLAVSDIHAFLSLIGRPDQHVLENLLFAAVVLAFARGLRDARLRPGPVLLLGALLALSLWNWLGSALTLLVVGASCALDVVVSDPERPTFGRAARLLAAGSAVAAIVLALSIGLVGPPGALRTFTLGGVSAFQVLLCAMTAALAASLLLARARSRLIRTALVIGIPTATLGLVALFAPGIREPILHGLTSAGAISTWHGTIPEFQPTFFSGLKPFREELRDAFLWFGLMPFLALVGLVEAWRRLRDEPERAPAIILAMVVAVFFGVATLFVIRFVHYGCLPLAVFAWLGLDLLRRKADRLRAGLGRVVMPLAAVAAIAPTVPLLLEGWGDFVPVELEESLVRIRELPDQGDRRAVLAPWEYGHHVLFHSGRPVIVSPFGPYAGPDGMEDATAFYTEMDSGAAERLLQRRGVQFVLLENPLKEVAALTGHGVRTGAGIQLARPVALQNYSKLVVARLYSAAGSANASSPALDAFRLVDEVIPATGKIRIFELVQGAGVLIRGAKPGGRLTAWIALDSPFGGMSSWSSSQVVDERGEARIRLPFATGRNGQIVASAWTLSDGVRNIQLTITEPQVIEGANLVVDVSRRR